MINNADAAKLLDRKRDGGVVIPTMNANNVRFGLPSVTTNEKLDLPLSGAMGKASCVGLGLALAHPERKVMVLDGDGSLLMNLGTMITIANKAPENLYHFLFNNGVYAVTGGQPVPGEGITNWEELAKSAGYAAVFSFDNLEDFANGVDEVLSTTGPVFINLHIAPEIENTPIQMRPRQRRNMLTAIRELPEALASRGPRR